MIFTNLLAQYTNLCQREQLTLHKYKMNKKIKQLKLYFKFIQMMGQQLKLLSTLYIINQQAECIRIMRSIVSTHQPRYRSVKYKLNREISIAANQTSSIDKRPFLPSTAKNSFSRSHHRNNHAKFSVSHINDFRNTAFNCQSPEEERMKRKSYMDSFHFLLSMQRNRYNAKQKDREQQQIQKMMSRQKFESSQDNNLIASKLERVQLPVLNQLQSQFTVLDNVNLPINYLNEQIVRLNKQMAVEQVNARKIQHQIKQIQKKTLAQLVQIEQIGMKGFQKLKNMIKANRVTHQEQNLKQKSALQKCRNYLPDYYNSLDESKQRLRELQDTIFKGTPFQLEQRKQFQPISSKYF